MKLSRFFTELLLPTNVACHHCEKEDVYKYGLCYDCYNSLKALSGDRCEICLDAINTEGLCASCLDDKPDYTKLFCLYSYAEPLSSLVKGLKLHNKRYLKYDFAKIALDSIDVIDKITLITSVPASKKRLRERGYNQAELIGRELSHLTDIPYDDVLIRTQYAKTAKLSKSERIKQLKGHFDFSKSVFNETVLLIDDVCTTGTTLRHCAKALKKAGAKEIFCCTILRTERKF